MGSINNYIEAIRKYNSVNQAEISPSPPPMTDKAEEVKKELEVIEEAKIISEVVEEKKEISIETLFKKKEKTVFDDMTYSDVQNYVNERENNLYDERKAIREESGAGELEAETGAVQDILTDREIDKEDDFMKFIINDLGCIEDKQNKGGMFDAIPIKRLPKKD